jgi:hypothetical protein
MHWMKRRRAAFSWRLLFRITETISGTLRSLIATGMIFYVLASGARQTARRGAFGAVAIILVLGSFCFARCVACARRDFRRIRAWHDDRPQ